MSRLQDLDELCSLDRPVGLIRIPDQVDVPLTARVRRLVDSAPFRRLAEVSQLGLVSQVYPGARHSRFEHSLGVYRLALLFLQRMSGQPGFAAEVDLHTAGAFLVAALLHDVGHWPYCHPMEDLALSLFPSHEQQALAWLEEPGLRQLLERDWDLQPPDVLRLLLKQPHSKGERIVCSMLSGPVDVDKMDYLSRDSLHAGVPYGRNFDPLRLISSLCLDARGERLAITSKGKTAAEMMVFARYVMFSEVYWHHAVRSATAMLQRAVFEGREQIELPALVRSTDATVVSLLRSATPARFSGLLDGLFGPQRQLYKRWWQSGVSGQRELYRQIAHRPYPWLVELASQLALRIGEACGAGIEPGEVLVDAPPAHLEIQFRVDVMDRSGTTGRPLSGVSPVVEALATRQFDDFVKQVRVFLAPRVAALWRPEFPDPQDLIASALQGMPQPASPPPPPPVD